MRSAPGPTIRVGDDPAFQPPPPTTGGSRVVDMAAALIARETITHAWQPNDPVFMPNGLLIHPAAFQRGIQGALARFSIELEDQIGRTRGSSAADPDLGRARGLLNFPPDIWFFDFGKSLLPTITSEQNYRAGRAGAPRLQPAPRRQGRRVRRAHRFPGRHSRPHRASTSARSRR